MVKQKKTELKTIKVSDKIWKELQMIKIKAGYNTIEDVIKVLLGEKQ